MEAFSLFKLALSILVTVAAGGLGSSFTSREIPVWYNQLPKPTFTPPGWLFGPVWTFLYLCMGISLYVIWASKPVKKRSKTAAYVLYFLQLIANALWSVIFFGMHNIWGAFVELCVLWVLILLTIVSFYKIKKVAAYLLIPYLLWVGFAGFLNFSLYLINK